MTQAVPTDKRKLTNKQRDVLDAIHWRKIFDATIRGSHRFFNRREGGAEVTAQIHALKVRGLVDIWYPTGGCEVNLTDAARVREAEWLTP